MDLSNLNIANALFVINQLLSNKVPFKTRLALSKNKKNLVEVYEVYQKTREELIFEYAKKDEDGKLITVGEDNSSFTVEENKGEFVVKMKALGEETTNIEIIQIEPTEDLESSLSELEGLDLSEALFLFNY